MIFPNLLQSATAAKYHDPGNPAVVRGQEPHVRKHKKKKYQKVDNPQNSDEEDENQDDEDLEGGNASNSNNTSLKTLSDDTNTTTPETFFDNFSSWRTDQKQEKQTELADLKPSKAIKPPNMLTMSENEIDSKRNQISSTGESDDLFKAFDTVKKLPQPPAANQPKKNRAANVVNSFLNTLPDSADQSNNYPSQEPLIHQLQLDEEDVEQPASAAATVNNDENGWEGDELDIQI